MTLIRKSRKYKVRAAITVFYAVLFGTLTVSHAAYNKYNKVNELLLEANKTSKNNIVEEPLMVTPEPTPTSRETLMFTTKRVNLRKNPNTECEVITVLNASELVTSYTTDENSEWFEVEYESEKGYIKSDYLRKFNQQIHLKDLNLDYVHQDLVREMIELFQLDIDEYFIYGMMYAENRFQNEPESIAGAQGILQIIPTTWESLYKDFKKNYPEHAHYIIDEPTDKTSNIILGMYYVAQIRDNYGYTSVAKNADAILTSYNRGMTNAKLYYKKHGTYSSEYSQEILRAAEYIREYKTWKEGL